MLIFVFAVAALGCLVVSIVRDMEILSYVSVGLCACGLVVFAVETLIRKRRGATTEPATTEPADEAEAEETGDDAEPEPVPVPVVNDDVVHIVAGRRRYHTADCRFIAGKDTDVISQGEAADEGFTPCTVCCAEPAVTADEESAGSTNHKVNAR